MKISEKLYKVSYWAAPGLDELNPYIPTRDKLKGLLEEVCRAAGFTVDEVCKKSRGREVVIVRQIYCYIAKKNTGCAFREIGESIRPDFDHATVVYSVNKVKSMISVKDKLFITYWKKCKYLVR